MWNFKDFMENWRKRREESWRKRLEQRASEIFQVEEIDGQLWFTCNGIGFCPCSLINGCDKQSDIIAFLVSIRELYVESE